MVKALTICQPWGWAIVHGTKRVENRSWPTNYRGPLLIHAGKSRARLADAVPYLRSIGLDPPEPDGMTFSAIVGVAVLVDCLPIEQVIAGHFAEGPLCWILEDVAPLPEPIPCGGALGLWKPSAQIVQLIEAQGVKIPVF